MSASNIEWHPGNLSRQERWQLIGCKGATLWFTGLSGSGKSTVAAALEQTLLQQKRHAYRLDGDNIRHGLNSNLGFSAEDRTENIRRLGEVARLFADSGVLAITSFISPYSRDRDACRHLHRQVDLPFIEVFVDAPLEVCESRDPKGLYKKARAGEIDGFTGVSAPYEPPVQPEVILHTATQSVEECVETCIAYLRGNSLL